MKYLNKRGTASNERMVQTREGSNHDTCLINFRCYKIHDFEKMKVTTAFTKKSRACCYIDNLGSF